MKYLFKLFVSLKKTFQDFQEGNGAPIFLLTSQVGGLGLTLTKADRVIVVDPAWNPRFFPKLISFTQIQ
jgi:SNF2 family DNA or RNA helicase